MISRRTRDALQAAKARGVKLGGLNAKGIQNRDEARQRAELLRPMLAELAGGAMQCIPLEGIAAKCPYGSAMARFGYLRSTCKLIANQTTVQRLACEACAQVDRQTAK